MIKSPKIFYLLAVLMLLTATGCTSLTDKVAEKYVEGATGTDIDVDGNSVQITDREGNVISVDSGNTLPADWPKGVVYYQAGTITDSSSLDLPQGKNFNLIILTTDDLDKIFAYYKDQLESDAWEIKLESHAEGNSLLLAEKDNLSLSLMVELRDDQWQITQTVAILK
ncbi:MAG: hypothetical protein RB292_05115 [Patescibacteria group bacterium]|jgi:hypothetical protein|nr:hypothetical protein [Patescibacteria group bacterium]